MSEPAKPDQKPPKYGGPERRERYRMKQDVKILVEKRGRSEVATITNMTRNGVYFQAFGDYHPGEMLDVTFPYNPTRPTGERPQHAEVVRVQELEGSMKKGIAVRLLNMFLKP